MRAWRGLHASGALSGAAALWFRPRKPIEELYDVDRDRDEVSDLAARPEYREVLRRMRRALEDWQVAIGDTGLIPEAVLMHDMKPGGRIETTAAVEARLGRRGLRLSSPTPGASIAYRFESDRPHWRLYAGPIAPASGATVEFKACRLGFLDSPPGSFVFP
jgi:hypothetical protein